MKRLFTLLSLILFPMFVWCQDNQTAKTSEEKAHINYYSESIENNVAILKRNAAIENIPACCFDYTSLENIKYTEPALTAYTKQSLLIWNDESIKKEKAIRKEPYTFKKFSRDVGIAFLHMVFNQN